MNKTWVWPPKRSAGPGKLEIEFYDIEDRENPIFSINSVDIMLYLLVMLQRFFGCLALSPPMWGTGGNGPRWILSCAIQWKGNRRNAIHSGWEST